MGEGGWEDAEERGCCRGWEAVSSGPPITSLKGLECCCPHVRTPSFSGLGHSAVPEVSL